MTRLSELHNPSMLHGHILGSGLAKNWFEEVERELNNH